MHRLKGLLNSVADMFGSERLGGRASLLLRAAVTALFIGVVLRYIDIGAVWQRIIAIRITDLALLLALVAIQTCILAFRWHIIARQCGAGIAAQASLRISVISLFFNQTMPSTVGGDAVRILLSRNEGAPIQRAACGVLIDRGIGVLALALISAAFLPWLIQRGVDSHAVQGVAVLAAVLSLGFAAFAGFGDALLAVFRKFTIFAGAATLARFLRDLVTDLRLFGSVLLLSFVIHIITGIVVIIAAWAMAISIPLAGIGVVFPALLTTMIPISIAGWGVREAAMIVALGYVGVSAADAFATSVAYGLIFVLAGIPGGILWLSGIGATDRTPAISQDASSSDSR